MRFNIDCVIDIGANRGQFRDFVREVVGFKGLVLSFEPVHHLAEIRKNHAKQDPAWHIFEMALGNANAHASINITRNDDLSSFLTPLGTPRQPFLDETKISKTELVEMRTLDSVIPQLQSCHDFRNVFL